MPLFSRLNDTRDVLFVDQRGTGGSNPLDCEDSGAARCSRSSRTPCPRRWCASCLEELDADPRQYVTPIAVEDLDEVRGALGYERVNLWGGSYGTRVALEYTAPPPRRACARTILDGVAPADMKLPLSFVADGEAALERLIDGCEAAVLCGKAIPTCAADRLDAHRASPPARARGDPGSAHRRPGAHPRQRERVPLRPLPPALRGGAREPAAATACRSAASGDFNPLLAQNLEFADDISREPLGGHAPVGRLRRGRAAHHRRRTSAGALALVLRPRAGGRLPARLRDVAAGERCPPDYYDAGALRGARRSSSRAASTRPRPRATATRSRRRCPTRATWSRPTWATA